jgi:hypothetical protein
MLYFDFKVNHNGEFRDNGDLKSNWIIVFFWKNNDRGAIWRRNVSIWESSHIAGRQRYTRYLSILICMVFYSKSVDLYSKCEFFHPMANQPIWNCITELPHILCTPVTFFETTMLGSSISSRLLLTSMNMISLIHIDDSKLPTNFHLQQQKTS